jgi:phosphoribosylanthranilate isomerase
MTTAPRIKFCGITRAEDAELAVSLGAWAVGMILWPGSPRAVTPDQMIEIAAAVRRGAELVGVFVNPTLQEVAEIAEAARLTMLQFHGQEGPAFCAEAARRTGCRVIKVARVRTGADIHALAPFHTDYHLLDSYVAGVPGGTGETFAWDLAADYKRLVPRQRGAAPVPVILCGGLRPANVGAAISVVQPFAVDVASGVERSPGVKDPGLMREFAGAVADSVALPA